MQTITGSKEDPIKLGRNVDMAAFSRKYNVPIKMPFDAKNLRTSKNSDLITAKMKDKKRKLFEDVPKVHPDSLERIPFKPEKETKVKPKKTTTKKKEVKKSATKTKKKR